MNSKFLVLKWEDIEDSLDNGDLNLLYDLLDKVTFDKPEKDYYVIDKSDPVAYRIPEVMQGKKLQISKSKAIEILKELQELKDYEIAHVEADEVLLKYINDKEIEEAFEGIGKLYS